MPEFRGGEGFRQQRQRTFWPPNICTRSSVRLHFPNCMLDYSRFASDEHEEEDHTRMDRRRFVRRAGFRFLGPSTIEEGKGRAAWHSDACVALGLIGHGIRANKHRAAWSWNARRFQRIKGCTVTLLKQRQSQNELEKLSNLSYVKKTQKLVEICLKIIKTKGADTTRRRRTNA